MFIPGIPCPLCSKAIQSASDAIGFSPFVSNAADPLFVFNDAAVHVECFHKHPLAKAAQVRYEEVRTRAKDRACFVCGAQIMSPDDYLAFGYLLDDLKHPLYPLNYAQFHRSCLGTWSALPEAIRNLEALNNSVTWKGDALTRLIKELHLCLVARAPNVAQEFDAPDK
jgi:hypothetical protein